VETVETVIIAGDEEDEDDEGLAEVLVTSEGEGLVDVVEDLLEEQVVVEDGVQYEIELL
jgi:hypothetical protein